ncbi:MAG: hypothetical protein JWO06_3694 [Bacteroidota bacterium]|nr:hypothetical protein [Bacteroidota bacterium]
MMKVRNVAVGNLTCKCNNWLEHWCRYGGGFVPKNCSEKSCNNSDLVGAHVQKNDSLDNQTYIIPLCTAHSHQREVMTIMDSRALALANPDKTCGGY